MWWAFQPFTMQGIYFSLCASTHLFYYIVEKPEKVF